MASKKDRFSKQVRKELGQEEPEATGSQKAEPQAEDRPTTEKDMSELVSDVRKTKDSARQQNRQEDHRTEQKSSSAKNRYQGSSSMARSRNVYNVSSDIRLEDYTEKAPSRDLGPILRAAGVVLIVIMIIFGIYRFVQFLMMPSYQLAVSSQQITESNIKELVSAEPILSAASPMHIRFEWPPGSLTTDYLRIRIDRMDAGSLVEEAMLGRRPPRTANYIYFLGPMDSGAYRITVSDADGTTLASKEVEVR